MRRRRDEHAAGKTLITVLTVVCLVLIGVSVLNENITGPIRSVTGLITTPVQKGITGFGQWLGQVTVNLSDTSSLREENEALSKQVETLMAENSQLLLEKSGFDIGRYVSIERIIERTAMEYYDALNACVEGWDRGRNDYAPYATYWLKTLHEAYRQLFAKLDASSNTGKSQRVRTFVEQAGSAVSKRQIREALADVSEATVEAALGKMVKEGIVQKVGAGRSTAYQWLG